MAVDGADRASPQPILYGADTTWITIEAAIIMGLSGVCLFIFAVKNDYFRDFEDAKYQVFWNDIEELVESVNPLTRKKQKGTNDRPKPKER